MPTMLLLHTTRFGEIETPEETRVRLLRPLAGFPDTQHLVRIALPRQKPFTWLQSVEEGAVAFAVAPADWLRRGYAVTLAPWDQEQWGQTAELEVLALLSFQNGPSANLAAPVLVDAKRRLALQVLNQSGGWGFAEPLARP